MDKEDAKFMEMANEGGIDMEGTGMDGKCMHS